AFSTPVVSASDDLNFSNGSRAPRPLTIRGETFMNFTAFSILVAALPVSVGLVSACGGTADVGNDPANVNTAGASRGTGGDPNVVQHEQAGTAGLGPGGAMSTGGAVHGSAGMAGSGPGGSGPGGSTGRGGATGTGGRTGAAGTGGGICGGLRGQMCGADEFCAYADP